MPHPFPRLRWLALAWGPPVVHVGAILACLWSAIYVPTHLLLLRAFPKV